MLTGLQVRLDNLLPVTGFSIHPVTWTGDAPCVRVEARGCLPGVFRCPLSSSQYGDQCFYRLVSYHTIKKFNVAKAWSKCGSSFCVNHEGSGSTINMERVDSQHFAVCMNCQLPIIYPGVWQLCSPIIFVQSTGLELGYERNITDRLPWNAWI